MISRGKLKNAAQNVARPINKRGVRKRRFDECPYSGDFSIGRAINGTTADLLGWSVAPDGSTSISGQTAAFETVTDVFHF